MSETIIKTEHLTKDYGDGHGIFDISIEVKRGEVYGFIGTNGSGKTTTIRNLMGFIRPDSGTASIMDKNTWEQSIEIKPYVSYVPGEISFPRLASGTEFLKLQAEYLGITDFEYMNKLIKMLQLDPSANLKRMSKGMKQKTALVAALMGNRDILILDEPTTGLDPLMRDVFLDLIREEKKKGKTIFMSSHIFEEIEDVCDKAAIIRDGKIIDVLDVYELRHTENKEFFITFADAAEAKQFADTCTFAECTQEINDCHILISKKAVSELIRTLKNYKLLSLSEKRETIEDRFHAAFLKGVSENAD